MSDTPKNQFTLRPLEKDDLATIATWFRDIDDLALFDRKSRIPLNNSQTAEIWNDAVCQSRDEGKCWFVVETASGQSVGLAGLDGISSINRDAVIPLFVDKSVRRHGVGIRTAALMLDLAFRQLGLNRVTSFYRADNSSTRDLVARLGFSVEGTMRQAWFADGQFRDMAVVGILKDDWFDRREALISELSTDTTVSLCPGPAPLWTWPPSAGSVK